MTNLLSMRSELHYRSYPSDRVGSISMGVHDQVSRNKIIGLKEDLLKALKEWPSDALIKDVLIEVAYDTVVSKTNRIKNLFKISQRDKVHGIVGARYEHNVRGEPYHVLTYYLTRNNIEEAAMKLGELVSFFEEHFADKDYIDSVAFERIGKDAGTPRDWSMSATKQAIHDCIHPVSISIPFFEGSISGPSIVGIFPTEIKAADLLSSYSKLEQREALIDNTTLLLDELQFDELVTKAPYLVTMTVSDNYDLDESDGNNESDDAWEDPLPFKIDKPTGEPTVGVIDTVFDTSSQLARWVEDHPMIDDGLRLSSKDYEHGTQVTSIIVAGHELNPELDDGCGWFQVRHFGVARKWGNSIQRLIQNITRIVEENPDIRVWNLSLGTDQEITPNAVSPLAACLDRLQSEKDILFIVAGTNDENRTRRLRMGSAGDSVNSIVVNSVRRDDTPASYSRRGPVLSFFTKPDISYYGGDDGELIHVLNSVGIVSDKGTSLAAPWIARKAAYLLEVLHLPRDVTKALLIDSALSWKTAVLEAGVSPERGYGVIPQRIEDVYQAKEDEIKFYISGHIENYETYSDEIPVPLDQKKYPYAARAVLVYAPTCNKKQGVDYTNTELSLTFGRSEDRIRKDGTPYIGIEGISDKFTSSPKEFVPYERAVREYKRKWDNVKVKIEKSENARSKKMLSKSGGWGMSIIKTDRLNDGSGDHLPFGLVVTLKAIDGNSRIENFIQQSSRHHWVVREVKPEERIRINQQSQKRIEFE